MNSFRSNNKQQKQYFLSPQHCSMTTSFCLILLKLKPLFVILALDYRIPAKKRKTLLDVWAKTDSVTQEDTNNASCDDSNDETNKETLAELRTNGDSNAGTKKEILAEFQTMLKDIHGIVREHNADGTSRDIWSIDQVEWLKSLDYLCMMMYSMGTYNCEIESISKVSQCCTFLMVDTMSRHTN